MSTPRPHAPPIGAGNQQDRQNRKLLLEHIEEQKKRLQHGHHSSSSSSPTPSMSASPTPILNSPSSVPGLTAAEYATISNPQQRAALQHAHANSVGFFITQDSSFGNLILPVLPRAPDVKVEPKSAT